MSVSAASSEQRGAKGCESRCPRSDGIAPKAEYRIGTRCDLDEGHQDHHRVYYMGDDKRLTSYTWWDELTTPDGAGRQV